jgi:RNA polymerase sigma-70 factor (ECF subfamily)
MGDMSDEAGREASLPADFDDTFRRWWAPMVRSLTVACGDAEVASDCVQDAFTRAYTRWRRVSRLDDPPGWIRHVALNRMRDHFRKTTRGRAAVERLDAQAAATAPEPAPPSDLATLLAGLPPQQRIAAALFYVEDLDVQHVAHAMGLSEGAVKYHLHAARQTLRRALEAQS